MLDNVMKTAPAVFAVGDMYQIITPVAHNCIMWAEVDGESYFDASNGIMRSQVPIHRISVPKARLDKAKKYTICYRKEIDRKPYFPEFKETVSFEFEFNPAPSGDVRAYQIADAHCMVDAPIDALRVFEKAKGKIDFLIMHGDIPDHSGEIENFDTIYEIADKATGGKIPIVFARGNHDMRGIYAERIADYTPNHNGNTYFTFRIGDIWGMVLDCGEDKDDSHPEYGGTVCSHSFRKEQTAFIKEVIKNSEYSDETIAHRLVVVHNPFTELLKPPFDIEKEVYTEWAELIKENIKPDIMMCGHFHRLGINMPGDESDHLGHPCPVVIGSKPEKWGDKENMYHAGCGIELSQDGITVYFVDNQGEISKNYIQRKMNRN